ncbi:MAG: MarR family transcriptional regulator [Pseudomonadota bacterium]|nr:MarR family transcriptional regulator [Pseudomonadota bacterium]
MPTPVNDPLAISLFSEISTIDHLLKTKLAKILPFDMEPSHFAVLNYLSTLGSEKTPAQLARSFNVTKGAMSNTVQKLLKMGYVHIRPDWEDGRSKLVSISKAGVNARNDAVLAIEPIMEDLKRGVGPEKIKALIPFLRALRIVLNTSE